jgi:hypothetical protein
MRFATSAHGPLQNLAAAQRHFGYRWNTGLSVGGGGTVAFDPTETFANDKAPGKTRGFVICPRCPTAQLGGAPSASGSCVISPKLSFMLDT